MAVDLKQYLASGLSAYIDAEYGLEPSAQGPRPDVQVVNRPEIEGVRQTGTTNQSAVSSMASNKTLIIAGATALLVVVVLIARK